MLKELPDKKLPNDHSSPPPPSQPSAKFLVSQLMPLNPLLLVKCCKNVETYNFFYLQFNFICLVANLHQYWTGSDHVKFALG